MRARFSMLGKPTFQRVLGTACEPTDVSRKLHDHYSAPAEMRPVKACEVIGDDHIENGTAISYLSMIPPDLTVRLFESLDIRNERKASLLMDEEMPGEVFHSIVSAMEPASFHEMVAFLPERHRVELSLMYERSMFSRPGIKESPDFVGMTADAISKTYDSPEFSFPHRTMDLTRFILERILENEGVGIWSEVIGRTEPKIALAYIFCAPVPEDHLLSLISNITGDMSFGL